MSKVKFTPDKHLSLPTKPLRDVGVPVVGATVSYEEEPKVKGLKLSISVKVKPSIEVFNATDDIDGDGVLGVEKETEDDFGPLKLAPTFKLSNEDAWVKYRFAAEASASGSAELGAAGLKIDADKEIVFADYRYHDRNDVTSAAIVADLLEKVRTADNPKDLRDLSEKDALLYAIRGQLTSSVTLSWSAKTKLTQVAAVL